MSNASSPQSAWISHFPWWKDACLSVCPSVFALLLFRPVRTYCCVFCRQFLSPGLMWFTPWRPRVDEISQSSAPRCSPVTHARSADGTAVPFQLDRSAVCLYPACDRTRWTGGKKLSLNKLYLRTIIKTHKSKGPIVRLVPDIISEKFVPLLLNTFPLTLSYTQPRGFSLFHLGTWQ